MKISASMVKELRDKTGVSMMECKKALVATEGNIEEAVTYLRERGAMKAEKKSARAAEEGVIAISVSDDLKKGAILTLNCETDFVAKNEMFVEIAQKIADVLLNTEAETAEELMEKETDGAPISQLISDHVLKLGEKIALGKFQILKTDGILADYVHMNAKTAVLCDVGFEPAPEDIEPVKTVGKEVCLQIAAMNPKAVDRTEFDKETIDKEKEILRNQLKDSKKPSHIIDKIVEGRMNKFFEEHALTEQTYVKDGDKKINDILKEYGEKAGTSIKINGFVRYSFTA